MITEGAELSLTQEPSQCAQPPAFNTEDTRHRFFLSRQMTGKNC